MIPQICCGLSLQGPQHPQNEDAIASVAIEEIHALVVIDGISSNVDSSVAAMLLKQAFVEVVQKELLGLTEDNLSEDFPRILEKALQAGHASLCKEAITRRQSMGAVLVAALVHEPSGFAVVAHAGDALAYKNGLWPKCITTPHLRGKRLYKACTSEKPLELEFNEVELGSNGLILLSDGIRPGILWLIPQLSAAEMVACIAKISGWLGLQDDSSVVVYAPTPRYGRSWAALALSLSLLLLMAFWPAAPASPSATPVVGPPEVHSAPVAPPVAPQPPPKKRTPVRIPPKATPPKAAPPSPKLTIPQPEVNPWENATFQEYPTTDGDSTQQTDGKTP